MKNRLNAFDWIALVVLVVGGLNWGLVGLLDFDLVAFIFGTFSTVTRVIYVIVGLCALYIAVMIPAKFGMQAPITQEPPRPAAMSR